MNIKRFPQIASNIFKYEMLSHHIAAKNHRTALHGLRQKLCFMVSKALAPPHRPSFSTLPYSTRHSLNTPAIRALFTHSLCVGRQGLYGSLKILQVLEADALPAYVLDSCRGSFYSEQPQKTDILPCLPWSMNKQADHPL